MFTKTRALGILQTLTNVAIIVASGCVAVVALQRMRAPLAPQPSAAAVYQVGEDVGPVLEVNFHKSPETLLMVVREDCH